MSQPLENKSAIVTGAASGMGAATARELATRGARALVVDRDEAGAKSIAEAIDGDFEPALRAFVRENAAAERCDYCGRKEDELIACSLIDFTQALQEGFDVDWEDALEFVPTEGDDWAIPEAVQDTGEILDEYDFELHEELRRDVIAHRFSSSVVGSRVLPREREAGWNRSHRPVAGRRGRLAHGV